MHELVLSDLPLFQRLPAPAQERLASMMSVRELDVGELVLEQGEASVDLYILAAGAVEVFVDADGTEVLLGELHAPTFFGLMGTLENLPRSSSVRVETNGVVLVVPKMALRFLEENHPVELLHFFQSCFLESSRRLRLTNVAVERHFVEKLREQKEAYDRIQELHEETLSVARARERILNHVSHELRTPIAIVGASVHVLGKRLEGDVKAQGALQRCHRNLQRLVDLQEYMLEIYQQKAPITVAVHELERIDLALLVEAAVADALDKASHRNVEIGIDAQRELYAMSPREPLAGALEGLIRNAIEATPDEGLVEIRVERSTEEHVVVAVRDYGVGIREDNLKHIFDGFFHVQDTERYSSRRPYEFDAGGKGLDLLRTRTYADRFGWLIEVDSKRCPFVPLDTDVCGGRVSDCAFIPDRSLQSTPLQYCCQSGQTEFRLVLPYCNPPGFVRKSVELRGIE